MTDSLTDPLTDPLHEDVVRALEAFELRGEVMQVERFGSGHINDTFLIVTRCDGVNERFVLQRLNTHVFPDIDAMMENIVAVTRHQRAQLLHAGADPYRAVMTVIPARDDRSHHRDQDGRPWRMYLLIEDTFSVDVAEDPRDLLEAGRAFGRFLATLDDFPAATLHEVIPGFHDTPRRLARFEEVLAADPLGRAASCTDEIAFVRERAADCRYLLDLLAAGEIPLRVTHNDTKLNNVLLDRSSREAICVVDLDTIMPGLAAYDVGDAIRTGASTGAEDERDLSRVRFDPRRYEAFCTGYLERCGNILTAAERRSLPWGARLMTLENGIRFLTDHLEGDVYFRIHREGHNLDRARTQFTLLADMERQFEAMLEIVAAPEEAADPVEPRRAS